MPAGCRRWTIYNLSWALLALKAAFSMTCNNEKQGVVQYEYPRFEKEACCSQQMYARCNANIALPPSPALAQALPHDSPFCLPHTLRELQTWLLDEDACLME